MERIPTSPPKIAAISLERRPLWSVMIPVYNGGKYLAEAIESVLAENVSEDEMQIEVIDDASTERHIESIVLKVGRNRVKYYRQEKNVGPLRNFETCINRSKGRLIHLLHQDDFVKPGYYAKMGSLFDKYPQIGAAFCDYDFIDLQGNVIARQPSLDDGEGVLDDWLNRIAERNRLQYACIVVKREVYEHIGSFFLVTYGEDWEMWTRIARSYRVAYTPEKLTAFRMHPTSQSGTKTLTGSFLKDSRMVIKAIQAHVRPEDRKRIRRLSNHHVAEFGLDITQNIWNRTRNKKAVRANAYELLRFRMKLSMLLSVVKLLLRSYK